MKTNRIVPFARRQAKSDTTPAPISPLRPPIPSVYGGARIVGCIADRSALTDEQRAAEVLRWVAEWRNGDLRW
jgi:hypothetical protein